MKIPENIQRKHVTNNNETGGEKNQNKHINLTAYRKKRKRKSTIIKLIAVLLVAVLLIVVWVNAETIFEPLRGIASKIENKTSYSVGFPINLPGSAEYSFEKFGDNFSLLTDTYLYTYKTTGEQIYALQHGYSKPEQVTNDKRILLFDKSAYDFSLYSKTSLIFEKKIDDKILFGALSDDSNLTAIVTDSDRYSNIIHIYDDGGNWKFTKKFADENVMQVSFVGDNEHIIVSTVSVDSGEIVINFYKISIQESDGTVWKYSYKGNSLPCGMYANRNYVMAVCDNIVISIDCLGGEPNNFYTYNGTLKNFDFSDNMCVIQYNESSTNKNNIVAIDMNGEAKSATTVSPNAQEVLIDGGNVYVLDGIHMKKFDLMLSEEEERTLLDDDYNEFIRIGRDIFLLGYDTVNTIVF